MTTAPTPVRGYAPQRSIVVLLAILVVLVGTGVVLLALHDWGSGTSANGLRGSGVEATQTRTLSSFSGIELAGSNKVVVHVGGSQSVVVHADDNLIGRVTTEVRAGQLVIGNRGSFTAVTPMSVDVTVPKLDVVSLSGSGLVGIDGVAAKKLTVRVAGSGLLVIGGTTDRLDASLAGSGDVQLQTLVARDAKVTVSGSGRMLVNATGTLDASVPGTGAIFYSGNPSTVHRSVSGTGAILPQ